MSRTPSATVLTSMMAQESAEGYVILLVITHPTIQAPIRLASHNEAFPSNGLLYLPFPFKIDMPGSDPESITQVRISIDNVDGSIAAGIRSVPPGTEPIQISMSVVTLNQQDTVEIGPIPMSLVSINMNRLTIQGTLTFEPLLDRLYPDGDLTPEVAPGMF